MHYLIYSLIIIKPCALVVIDHLVFRKDNSNKKCPLQNCYAPVWGGRRIAVKVWGWEDSDVDTEAVVKGESKINSWCNNNECGRWIQLVNLSEQAGRQCELDRQVETGQNQMRQINRALQNSGTKNPEAQERQRVRIISNHKNHSFAFQWGCSDRMWTDDLVKTEVKSKTTGVDCGMGLGSREETGGLVIGPDWRVQCGAQTQTDTNRRLTGDR